MATIPRHSTTPGLLPSINKMFVGEITINTSDRAIWTTNGTSLIKLNGASRVEQLDDFSSSFANTSQLGNRTLIQWDKSLSQWVPTTKIEIGLNASAFSDQEVAIGKGSSSGFLSTAIYGKAGENSVVIGNNNGEGLSKVIAVGNSINLSSSSDSVSIGHSVVSRARSVVIGNDAVASKDGAIVIGSSSIGLGVSIGENSVSADNGIAIGGIAGGVGSIAIGAGAATEAENSIQLGSGINSQANSLKFRDNTLANSVGVQVRTVNSSSELNALSSANAGTLVIDLNGAPATLYMRTASSWAVVGTAAFDASTVSLGTLNNVRGVGAGNVDSLGSPEEGYFLRWGGSEWRAEPNVINCGSY